MRTPLSETDAHPVRWGILSTASIGRTVVPAIAAAEGAEAVAVGGRDLDRTRAFAAELGIPVVYGSYQELLDDPEIDAVYVPLPISLHSEWTGRALEAGKHVLCEKPLAATIDEVEACFDAADRTDRLCIEGLMWRQHPRTLLAQQLLADGAVGELAHVRAALTVSAPAGDIRRTGALGGGARLDLGCYCVSGVRLFAGEPEKVLAARILDTAPGADGGELRMAATLQLPGDVLAQIDVGLDLARRDELELIGTEGILRIPDPWLCRRTHVEIEREGEVTRVDVDPDLGLTTGEDSIDAYRIEIENASDAFAGGAPPRFGREDARAQAAVLEALHDSILQKAWVDLTHTSTPTR